MRHRACNLRAATGPPPPPPSPGANAHQGFGRLLQLAPLLCALSPACWPPGCSSLPPLPAAARIDGALYLTRVGRGHLARNGVRRMRRSLAKQALAKRKLKQSPRTGERVARRSAVAAGSPLSMAPVNSRAQVCPVVAATNPSPRNLDGDFGDAAPARTAGSISPRSVMREVRRRGRYGL